MKKHCVAWSALGVGGRAMVMKVLVGVPILALALASTLAAEVSKPVKPALLESYGKLPLSFEANDGQADPQAKFLSRGRGYTLFLTSTEAVLVLREGESARNVVRRLPAAKRERGKAVLGTVLRMTFVGANPAPAVAGVGELPGKSNYFVGDDPKKWRANVPTYAKVEYRDVYPGVNLVYYGNQRQLEHDFVVSPGADPKAITLAFEGVDGVAIDALGDLVLRAEGGEVRLRKPFVYQDHDGQRVAIPTRYVIKAEHQVAFEVTAYDATKPLIIDPVLGYSTFLGGSADEIGNGIAVDKNGNAYVTGSTPSTDFPGTTGLSGAGDAVAFVTKLNPTGSLVYSTFLGGSSRGDSGNGIAVDASGNAYVTGLTRSENFPKTTGREFIPFAQEAFATKLDQNGGLSYSTFFLDRSVDDSVEDSGNGIAVDALGNAYVTGSGNGAFVAKLNPNGSLAYSTFLGSGHDSGNGIAVDAAGNAYVTGLVQSEGFPTTASAVRTSLGARLGNAFVTKLAANGGLAYSTYLGGSGTGGGGDEGDGIAVDGEGNAYVTGTTASNDFDGTGGSGAPGPNDTRAFVAKLNTSPSVSQSLVYSTYLGGPGGNSGTAIALDAERNAYVTGLTFSANFPTTGAAQTAFPGIVDAFVTKLDPNGGLAYSTYLSESRFNMGFVLTEGLGIAVDAAGRSAYVTGLIISFDGSSANFPTTPGAAQESFGGGSFDAFVTKLNINTTTPFAAFHARVEIEDERDERECEVKGTFTLGTGSDGIHPDTEVVTLQVGAFAATIPAGSFRRHGHRQFKFEGVAGGATLEMKIHARGRNRFEFKAEGKGAGLTGTTNPVEVTLTIGNDGGNTVSVKAKLDD